MCILNVLTVLQLIQCGWAALYHIKHLSGLSMKTNFWPTVLSVLHLWYSVSSVVCDVLYCGETVRLYSIGS